MNSLNSVLIEGVLVTDPCPCDDYICHFIIVSDRFYKEVETIEKESSYFSIKAIGRLGEKCLSDLKKGRGVRVVGRLKQDGNAGQVIIVAEHVEFKPIYTEDVK